MPALIAGGTDPLDLTPADYAQRHLDKRNA